MRRIFFTSPVDDDSRAGWPDFAARLGGSAETALGPGGRVELGGEPVFGYGQGAAEFEEALLRLEDLALGPRTVRIDLWSSIARYGAICITVGDGVVRKERRALEKGLKKVLRGESLIHQSNGPFDRDERRIYGYRLDPADDRARSSLADLLLAFDPPHYLGERWMLQGDDERIDESRYEIWPGSPNQLARFLARSEDAAERAWSLAEHGDGLIVMDVDDPEIGRLLQGFSCTDDLRWLPGKTWQHRVTLGRCRPGDHLVVVYDSQALPSDTAQWVFAI